MVFNRLCVSSVQKGRTYGLVLVAIVTILSSTALVQAGPIGLDFSSSDGGLTGTGNWAYDGSSWYVNGHTSHAYYYLTTPAFEVDTAGTVTGDFTHRYNFESWSDGGQIQFRVNAGAWSTVPADLITGVTYDNGVYGFYDPANPGVYAYNGYLENGFNGVSSGYGTPSYVTSSFTLGTGASPYSGAGSAALFAAGDQVEFQFKAAYDVSTVAANPNWQVTSLSFDNVSVPEPGTVALAGIALFSVSLRRRRRLS